MQPERQEHGLTPGAIIVMGVSGSGKSTLGQLLAETLGCSFIEGDDLHCPTSIEKMRSGRALGDEDRWPWLDRLGKALHDMTAAHSLAVAACSALKYRYRERLVTAIAAPTSFIMLEADRDELARRMGSRTGHYMPTSLLDSQFAALERPHGGERALILDANASPEALCRASRAWLTENGGQEF
ncbi:MAG TPA: gluconokinase [Sphingobium sp.]